MRILASPFVAVPVAALFALNIPPAIDRSNAAAVAHSLAPVTTRQAADFRDHSISSDARHLATWIAGSRDNGGAAFAIVDKKSSMLHVFDRESRLRASSIILLGERDTPDGRYETRPTSDLGDGEVFWVNHESRLAMHSAFSINPAELRLQRKSLGCINVPASFFKEVMRPSFAAGAVVYILPEAKRMDEVFAIGRAVA